MPRALPALALSVLALTGCYTTKTAEEPERQGFENFDEYLKYNMHVIFEEDLQDNENFHHEGIYFPDNSEVVVGKAQQYLGVDPYTRQMYLFAELVNRIDDYEELKKESEGLRATAAYAERILQQRNSEINELRKENGDLDLLARQLSSELKIKPRKEIIYITERIPVPGIECPEPVLESRTDGELGFTWEGKFFRFEGADAVCYDSKKSCVLVDEVLSRAKNYTGDN